MYYILPLLCHWFSYSEPYPLRDKGTEVEELSQKPFFEASKKNVLSLQKFVFFTLFVTNPFIYFF